MRAKELEGIISEETRNIELSHRSPADVPERFQRLRDYRLLPAGREKYSRHLSLAEIAAGILSIATAKPGFAGLAVKLLKDLRPVGGPAAGFHGCPTFGHAMETILGNSAALDALIELRVSECEIYTNGHCRAAIEYASNRTSQVAHYVGPLAVSLLQPGAENTFNPRELISRVITETVFYPRFFKAI